MSSRSPYGAVSERLLRAARLSAEVLAAAALSVVPRLPGRCVEGIAWVLGSVFWATARGRRRVALANLARAYAGEKSDRELHLIGRRSFVFLPLVGMDLVWQLARWLGDRAGTPVHLEGLERLEQALEGGTGAVVVLPHLGVFPLAGVALARRGLSPAYIYRHLSSERLDAVLCRWAERAGVRLIPAHPRERCVRESLEHLRAGGVLLILGDQRSATATVTVPFFGVPTETALGPAVLAARVGAAILPAACVRLGCGRHVVHICEPLPPGTPEEQARAMNKAFERWIRRYPEQWFWLHRRWR